jgi:prepilin-type N-terminal cleavage/methylation domain-containing protein
MPHPSVRSRSRPSGFSLVEMLVVLGIIVIVTALLLPAAMRSRKSARAVVCISNLRQLGQFYYLYADANRDLIPLGISTLVPVPAWWTAWNQYLWLQGGPSAACGPFLRREMVGPGSAKIFHCPNEAVESCRWEAQQQKYERAARGDKGITILISYAVRPVRALWVHHPDTGTVDYPYPMPKLVKQKHFALLAEHPQVQPYTHGEGSHFINVLYADASVRMVPTKKFREPLKEYVRLGAPVPGMNEASNLWAINEIDKTAATIWKIIDNY